MATIPGRLPRCRRFGRTDRQSPLRRARRCPMGTDRPAQARFHGQDSGPLQGTPGIGRGQQLPLPRLHRLSGTARTLRFVEERGKHHRRVPTTSCPWNCAARRPSAGQGSGVLVLLMPRFLVRAHGLSVMPGRAPRSGIPFTACPGSPGAGPGAGGYSVQLVSQPAGPLPPAGYSSSSTLSSAQAVRIGSTIRQHSSAVSPRTDSVGSPASTPSSTSP